jgi:hypothetical protein
VKPRLLDLFCGAGGAAMGTSPQLAWAAGFFDGEGCVSVRRDKRPGRKPALHLDIEQTDERPLRRFHAAVEFKGSISLRPQRAPTRKPLYRLYMGRKAKVVQVYGNAGDSSHWAEAMGIDWMERHEMTEAIPPAYCEHIGHYLMNHLAAKESAAA